MSEDTKNNNNEVALFMTHCAMFILGMFLVWQIRKCDTDKSRDKVICKVSQYKVDIKNEKPDFKIISTVNVIKPKWTCSHNWLDENLFEKGEVIKNIEEGPE